MKKSWLAALVVVAILAGTLGRSVLARTQSSGRFEYTKVAAYSALVQHAQLGQVWSRVGYRACQATSADWTCRDFAPENSADAGLRTALVTLGSEGWELVVLDHDEGIGQTFWFKRRIP
jgi:hypothetical protein